MPPAGWYYRLSAYFKEKIGERVYKIPLNASFTCPNRDGTISDEGCIFCYNPGFSPPAAADERDGHRREIKEQILDYQLRMEKRNLYRSPGRLNRAAETASKKGTAVPRYKYMAYFQSYSNTYAPVSRLRHVYDQALSMPGVIGLSIATRPDCLRTEVLDLLEEYARKYHFWLEVGLQSAHDRTLELINRGHTFARFQESVSEAARRGITVCVHIINGLPGESEDEMLETIERLNDLPVKGIKFHQLQIIKHTPLEKQFRAGKIKVLTRQEYLQIICNQLEILRRDIVVHRLLSEVFRKELLIAPHWEVFRGTFSQEVERELRLRRSYQGIGTTGGG
ncbi:MAG: TIGR01212 family radical SAM protein [Dethiobacteria bacterium]